MEGVKIIDQTMDNYKTAFIEVRAKIENRLRILRNPPPTSPQLSESLSDKEARRLMIEELTWVLEGFESAENWYSLEK
jgi:hypothetical protein